MISSRSLRVVGIVAAVITAIAGIAASNSIDRGTHYGTAAAIAGLAFAIWAVCATVLLVRLCRQLYVTRANRTGLVSALWLVALVWAPIVVPLLVRSPLNGEGGSGSAGSEDVQPMKTPFFALSVWIGFLWAIALPIVVAVTVARVLPVDACRQSHLIMHKSEWWRWWDYSGQSLAWPFVGLAGFSLVVALGCIVRQVSDVTAVHAALWLSMAVGTGAWLFLVYLLFWLARCA